MKLRHFETNTKIDILEDFKEYFHLKIKDITKNITKYLK